jgi:hypothetical protein
VNELQTALLRTCFVSYGSERKSGRYWGDFLRDKIAQAACEPTLSDYFESLTKLLGSSCEMPSERARELVAVAHSASAPMILEWLRKYPNTAAIACMSKKEDRDAVIETISFDGITAVGDGAIPLRSGFDISISARCESPLAHGDDAKAGNATLFRKMDVIYKNGTRGSLPFYSGNALRGQLRDVLASHFLATIGISSSTTNPAVELWFFHALYAGGALEEGSKVKLFMTETGDNGSARAIGINRFRDMVPCLSLLGSAIGARIISGRVNVCDMRPECKQWGSENSPDVNSLYTWEFLTRRDDYDGRNSESSVDENGKIEKAEKSKAMIANTQCLVPGTVLLGGIMFSDHANEIERSAIGLGLSIMSARGFLGAENRRGFGRVALEFSGAQSGDAYENYLRDHRDEIVSYLGEIGAYKCTPSN